MKSDYIIDLLEPISFTSEILEKSKAEKPNGGIADELFNELKRILPKHIFLSFDGILTMDWDKFHQEFIECANKTMEE